MFDEIDAAFNVGWKKVISACGDVIYNPNGATVSPSLMAHEKVHGQRQGSDIAGWWRRYIDDPAFRLAEEIPAHQAEYWHIAREGNRPQRRKALKIVASKLAAPLYGRMISLREAKREIAIEPRPNIG